MWELRLIELLAYYSWPLIDICWTEHLIVWKYLLHTFI
jgi:hypothetical protein